MAQGSSKIDESAEASSNPSANSDAAASLSEIGENVIALIERLERRGPSEGKD